ncbi:MAG: hypothetical protein AB1397_06430 [bacterium]
MKAIINEEEFISEYASFIILPERVLITLNEIEKGIKERLNKEDFYIIMGMLWEKEEAYMEAIKCYQELIKLSPEDKQGYQLLSSVYEKIGFYEKAMLELKKH